MFSVFGVQAKRQRMLSWLNACLITNNSSYSPAQTTIQKKRNRKKETMTPTCWCKYLHNQACPFSQTLSDGVGGGLWGRGETPSPHKCCIYLLEERTAQSRGLMYAHILTQTVCSALDTFENCIDKSIVALSLKNIWIKKFMNMINSVGVPSEWRHIVRTNWPKISNVLLVQMKKKRSGRSGEWSDAATKSNHI